MEEKVYKPLIVPEVELESSIDNCVQEFKIGPLEPGSGTTLGNALRRVLLSSVEGSAIACVAIKGVNHEFSRIEGVVEDVLQITLNLKKIVIKNSSGKPGVLRIDKTGPGVVTAADIVCDHNLEVVNKDLFIATLESNANFSAEFFVEVGRGYQPALWPKDIQFDKSGKIYLDSMFSPIKRVEYNVSKMRVGDRIDHDQLYMKIVTNGSILPLEAYRYSISVLISQFNSLLIDEKKIDFDMTTCEPSADKSSSFSSDDVADSANDSASENGNGGAEVDIYLKSIDDLELSVRAHNCLVGAGIKRVIDLVNLSEDDGLKIKNFGRKTLREVKEVLKGLNLEFNMNIKEIDLKKALNKKQQA